MPTTLTSAPPALLARFRTVRAATLAFTAPLSPEDMMVQSSPDASPVKWHLAHTSWFFETFVLTPYAQAYRAFHPDFHWLFNSYYTSLGDMPAKNLRSSFSRPPLADIVAYRQHVDAAIAALLEDIPQQHEDDILRRIVLGLEHEQQHLELIATDIKHAFYTNPLHPAYSPGAPSQSVPSIEVGSIPLTFTAFEGGLTQIGITPPPQDPEAFAFDNETPRHTVFLQPFQIANRLITVSEYLAFMEDHGYTRPELWLSEGWSTMRREGWTAPQYWTPTADSWQVFTLHGYRPIADLLDTPVCHLSLFEADAYARWAGCRLPTEFEWEHAASSLGSLITGTPDAPHRIDYPIAAEHAASTGAPTDPSSVAIAITDNLLETGALHPASALPVNTLQQCFGDVWEWTSSGYTGYPGYTPLPGALGEYNGKFMSSQVIFRGGSCVTPATHIRPTYRNFFPPATRWQFSGLRLAKN